jgi:hypothetical protein
VTRGRLLAFLPRQGRQSVRAANETRGARGDDPLGILDIAAFVIDQRPVECLFWVTGGKTHCEYMISELPQIADIVGSGRCRRTGRQRSLALRWGNDQSELAPSWPESRRAACTARRLDPPASDQSPRRASVLAHPMPVLRHDMAGHKRAEQPLVPKRDDRYLLIRGETRLAEGARFRDKRGGIGMSRPFLGECQATARAPFCQTRQ